MITGVILARNEEHNIVACLEALQPHVAEILLIDMESTDRTVELAQPYVDKVLRHPLVAQFDAARNIAIPEARHEWLWFIDADERVPTITGQWANEFVRQHGDQAEAVVIPFKTHFCGKWIEHCGWWPGYTMPRLLKRGHFKFSQKLHTGVEVDGRQIRLPPDPAAAIEHFSYRSIEHYLEKLNRYTSTESQQLADQGMEFDWERGIRHMTTDLWAYYEANRGQLDGEHGWALSWLSGQYRWLSHAKLLDRKSSVKGTDFKPSVPEDLDEVLGVMRDQLATLRARSPELPLGIVWRSPVWDASGYADESRAYLKALACGARPVRLEEIAWNSQRCQLPEAETTLLRCLTRAERPRHYVTITDCIPGFGKPDPSASLNILRTMFETDRIPMSWPPRLQQFDEIWVPSRHNFDAFRRSGVAPEKMRVVPGCVDTERYRPDGPRLKLSPPLPERFVFLSVFDWTFRKGWDVLLSAYCQEFQPDEGTGLLLKFTRNHGHEMPAIIEQIDDLLGVLGQSLARRPDIVLDNTMLDAQQIAALYRSVQAFVLPSRGEGWGRPYIEAMASGLPTIGTRGTGNLAFMNDENSLLIDTVEVDVPEQAFREIGVYEGHRWQEPNNESLRAALRQVFDNGELRAARAAQAVQDVRRNFDLAAGRQAIEVALTAAEERFVRAPAPAVQSHQIRVEIEGELFACHSFSKINELLALEFLKQDDIALSLQRVPGFTAFDEQVAYTHRLRPYIYRPFAGGPEVVVRHKYPPNWTPPAQGKWVHIQPWEFGRLPVDWLRPLRDQVDEIWAPSHYVKRVYVESGIPEQKIQVIPWGVDPEVYSPDAPARLLPTAKRFAFLFVGGTIHRKGFDLLLDAYLAEFTATDDVCLVVKDIGTNSFYQDATHRSTIQAAMADAKNPTIVYTDEVLTEGQLASLYAACHCFVAPYRGEGFGLPILEAMACGLPAIVPCGGPTDDFVSQETGILLPAQVVQEDYRPDQGICRTHLKVSPEDLRRAMRQASENADQTRAMGARASQFVRSRFTWEKTAALMRSRLQALVSKSDRDGSGTTARQSSIREERRPMLSACLVAGGAPRPLADCLAHLRPFVDQVVVCDRGSTDQSSAVAGEYSADIVPVSPDDDPDAIRQAVAPRISTRWSFWIDVETLLHRSDLENLQNVLATQSDQIDKFEFRLHQSCRTDDQPVLPLLVVRNAFDRSHTQPDGHAHRPSRADSFCLASQL